MSTLDWTVLLIYLIGIVIFGYWVGRNNRKLDDFFLAGREMPWWAVGLSVMATQISAITFVGTTGQGYGDGMRFLVVYFALPFAMVILCVTLVPFFYRAKVFTAYEYLEQRFDLKTRTITSLLFLLQRGLAVGVTLYAPALVLSTILGISEGATILLMGVSTIIYVLTGGNRSVIWTDVVQMLIIWLGIFACFFVAIWKLPDNVSFRDALAIEPPDHRRKHDRVQQRPGAVGPDPHAPVRRGRARLEEQRPVDVPQLADRQRVGSMHGTLVQPDDERQGVRVGQAADVVLRDVRVQEL